MPVLYLTGSDAVTLGDPPTTGPTISDWIQFCEVTFSFFVFLSSWPFLYPGLHLFQKVFWYGLRGYCWSLWAGGFFPSAVPRGLGSRLCTFLGYTERRQCYRLVPQSSCCDVPYVLRSSCGWALGCYIHPQKYSWTQSISFIRVFFLHFLQAST